MSATRLIYFDVYGRGEAARILLTLGKIAFEDVRIAREDWPTYKTEHAAELEFGQVPVLEHDGKVLNQSHSIVRYLGRVTGHYPSDPYQAWRVDSFVDALADTMSNLAKINQETDTDKKIELFTTFAGETFPAALTRFEARLAANSNPNFLVGDSLTTADVTFLSVLNSVVLNEGFEHREPLAHALAQNPLLSAYAAHHNSTTLAEYLAARPVRPF